jgi:hypothetical protein
MNGLAYQDREIRPCIFGEAWMLNAKLVGADTEFTEAEKTRSVRADRPLLDGVDVGRGDGSIRHNCASRVGDGPRKSPGDA